MTSKRSSAFTLVELLVVIAIIGMLAALALPAINAAVASARRTTCSNNQRELGQAIMNYSSRKLDTFPGYRKIAKDNSSVSGGRNRIITWQVMMMSELGRADLYEAIQKTLQAANPTAPVDLTDVGGSNLLPYVELSACPEDFTITNKTDPVTSYVVNTGKWDDIASSPPDNKYRVFHDHATPSTGLVKFSTSDIKDGVATTLMIAENMDASYYMEKDADYDANNSERGTGFVWWYSGSGNVASPSPIAVINGLKGELDPSSYSPAWPPAAIPMSGPQDGHYAARPASGHTGGVVVTFCGGNTDFLRDDIDYDVYCRLLAPNDAKSGLPAGVLNEGSFR